MPSRLDALTDLLPRHGWRVVVALAWGNEFHDPQAFKTKHPALETTVLDGRSGTRASRLLSVESAIGSVRPAVVVPLCLYDALEGARRGKEMTGDTRLLFGLHEISAELLLDAKAYRPVIDRFVANSRLTCRLLIDVVGASPDRVDYVGQGVPAAVRSHVHRPGPIQLGYFGRLSPDKRVLDLPQVCLELDRRQVDFRMLVVGDGPLRSALGAAMEPWRARGVFTMSPPAERAELYDWAYPSLDVSMLFSPREGSPNLPLESMAHGVVPVVADFQGRASEGILLDQRTALVFPVGDLTAAAACVDRLFRDVPLRNALGQCGRSAVAALSLDAMALAWARSLDVTCEGPPARGQVDVAPSAPGGRLERWLGPRLGESTRRLAGRRYRHPDPGEWPFSAEWPDEQVQHARRAIDSLLEHVAGTPIDAV